MVRILDRAGIQDKIIIEMVVEGISQVNEIDKLDAGDLRLLMRFFAKKEHIMAVKKNGIRQITELANAVLRESLERNDS